MKKIAFAASVFLFSLAAHANYSNLYTSVNVGPDYIQNVYQAGQSVSGVSVPAATLFMGAPANQYIAPEVLASYDRASSLGYVLMFGADIKLMLPFGVNNNWTVFVRGGAAYGQIATTVDGSSIFSSGAVPVFGGGFGYRFKSEWVVTTEFDGGYFGNQYNSNGHGLMGGWTVGLTRFWDWW